MKGGWAYGNKLSMVITINLNSRSVAYIRRKLLKRLIPKNLALIQIQKDSTFNSDQFNTKQIIQIIVINCFSTHSYIVDIS